MVFVEDKKLEDLLKEIEPHNAFCDDLVAKSSQDSYVKSDTFGDIYCEDYASIIFENLNTGRTPGFDDMEALRTAVTESLSQVDAGQKVSVRVYEGRSNYVVSIAHQGNAVDFGARLASIRHRLGENPDFHEDLNYDELEMSNSEPYLFTILNLDDPGFVSVAEDGGRKISYRSSPVPERIE